MIDIHALTAGYAKKTVLKNLSIQERGGQFIILLGANGSGKSTLLKAIAGLLPIDAGHIKWKDNFISNVSRRMRAQKISYLSQSRHVAEGFSVYDVVALGRTPYRGGLGRLTESDRLAIKDALERTEMDAFKTRPYKNLSGGEQARILLARALAVQAELLLVDEPIAALDPYYQLAIMDCLKQEVADGKLVIATLHDLSLAYHYADCIWLLHDGEILSHGHPDKTLSQDMLVTAFGITPPDGGFQSIKRARPEA